MASKRSSIAARHTKRSSQLQHRSASRCAANSTNEARSSCGSNATANTADPAVQGSAPQPAASGLSNVTGGSDWRAQHLLESVGEWSCSDAGADVCVAAATHAQSAEPVLETEHEREDSVLSASHACFTAEVLARSPGGVEAAPAPAYPGLEQCELTFRDQAMPQALPSSDSLPGRTQDVRYATRARRCSCVCLLALCRLHCTWFILSRCDSITDTACCCSCCALVFDKYLTSCYARDTHKHPRLSRVTPCCRLLTAVDLLQRRRPVKCTTSSQAVQPGAP